MSKKISSKKYDAAKLRWDLLPWPQVREVVQVLTSGAKKYGDDNWKALPDFSRRYFAAAMRHLTAWEGGEAKDPETGLSHLAHAVCSLLFLMWRRKDGPDKN